MKHNMAYINPGIGIAKHIRSTNQHQMEEVAESLRYSRINLGLVTLFSGSTGGSSGVDFAVSTLL